MSFGELGSGATDHTFERVKHLFLRERHREGNSDYVQQRVVYANREEKRIARFPIWLAGRAGLAWGERSTLSAMKVLGLTGDIAAGKSTVGRLLQARGAAHLDADLGVRELYARPPFAQKVAASFGDVLDESGGVDRVKLAAIVFGNNDQLRELEALVHPEVAALRREQLQSLKESGADAVVVEAVKLLESGQGRECDEVWCVRAWRSVQMQRLVDERHLARDEAELRLKVQPSPEAKRALAGDVPLIFLDNNGSLEDLEARVEWHWQRFMHSESGRLL